MIRIVLIALFSCMLTFCFAQTQQEMNTEAMKQYKQADAKLNTTYQKILSDYKTDTAFIKNFKTAQRLWIQFRDAEMKALYPDREQGYYGSMQPLCWYTTLQQITEERIKQITVWLTGVEEGEGCAGSVKNKQ